MLASLEARGAWIEIDDRGQVRGLDLNRPVYQSDRKFVDKDLKSLRVFSGLVSLDLSTTAITDAGLQSLGDLSQLRILRLAETEITGQRLGVLSKLPNLEVLDLSDTNISPDALVHIDESVGLKSLQLSYSNSISDLSLGHLSNLTQLESLGLTLNPISDAGMKQA